MKEFKGTPGPWQAGSETTSGDIRVVDMNGSMVAMVEAKTGDGYLWSPSTVTENASLIAAAPELLEALLRVRAQFLQAGFSPIAGSLNPVEDNFAFINSAIDKALGESQ